MTGMVVAAVGSVTTWVTVSDAFLNLSASGWDKDGKLTIFLALAAFAFFLVGLVAASRWPFAVGLVITVIIGAIIVIDMVDIVNTMSLSNVGYGLYVAFAGAVMGLIAGIGGITSRRA